MRLQTLNKPIELAKGLNINMKVLAIIPARGGSKGIPNKNMTHFHGTSLVGLATKAACGSINVTHTMVSTDESVIANEAAKFGASFIGFRPPELSSDSALDQPVLRYELNQAERHFETIFEIVVMLQPTSPLRTSIDVDLCVNKLIELKASSVWTISPIEKHFHYKKQLVLTDEGTIKLAVDGPEVTRRQDLNSVFRRNGAVYVYTRDTVLNDSRLRGSRCYGVTLSHVTANIDTLSDLEQAEKDAQVIDGELHFSPEVQ